jgi:hypothetical protein
MWRIWIETLGHGRKNAAKPVEHRSSSLTGVGACARRRQRGCDAPSEIAAIVRRKHGIGDWFDDGS